MLASRVSYVDSAEHKTYPSAAGRPARRYDATKCDASLHGDFVELTSWLSRGILAGSVGTPWEGDFPRYVWVKEGDIWYEGRLVNSEQGTYKGYAIRDSELPAGL